MTDHPLSMRARRAADALLEAIGGAHCALVASADGFPIAHAQRRATDADRLAALVSSIGALGETAASESRIGNVRCLVVEATQGRLVIRCFRIGPHAVALAVLADPTAVLGLVWTQLAQAEQTLAAAS